MPTATYPPRCPHRVANSRTALRLTLLSALLLASTSATVSLHGSEIDYRLVAPASHMQPWPDDEAEIFIVPPVDTPLVSPRMAQRPQRRPTSPSKLPGPVLENPSSDDASRVDEVLVVPQPNATGQQVSPKTNSRDCYEAPPLAALTTSIALPEGKLPTSTAAHCAQEIPPTVDPRLVGAWAGTELHWSATCSHHRPLYFEEINAERYGYTMSYCLQPVISAARFFATIPALPYKMAVDHPRDCVYTLGHYRPGSCVPRRCNRLPWKLGAVAVETGFIAGLILLVP